MKKLVCWLLGHSRIIELADGFEYFGRCHYLLGSEYDISGLVLFTVLGHPCDTCCKNYSKMTWKDKFLVPYPLYLKEPGENIPTYLKLFLKIFDKFI